MSAVGSPIWRSVPRLVVALVLGCALLLLAPAASVLANTFNVTQVQDAEDPTPGDGVCDVDLSTPGNQCSLRAAVQTANALGGSHIIRLPAGSYVLVHGGPGEDAARTGDLDITANITIQDLSNGAGVTINGNGSDRVFDVQSGGSLTVVGTTITNGRASDGGAIRVFNGNLTLLGTNVNSNSAPTDGGGIYLTGGGTATLYSATVSGNSIAAGAGGGILTDPGTNLTLILTTLTGNSAVAGGALATLGSSIIQDSTFDNNTAGDSGAILLIGGSLTMTESTLSNNQATNSSGTGGGLGIQPLSGAATADLTNVTLTSNQAAEGGGLFVVTNSLGATVNLTNVTFGINTATVDPTTASYDLVRAGSTLTANIKNTVFAATCGTTGGPTVNDSGGNARVTGSGCPGTDRTLNLGTPQDNGGFVKTLALGSGSGAKDTGTNTGCPLTDARHVQRTPAVGDGLCDAGAFEVHVGTTSPVVMRIPDVTIDEDGSTGPLPLRFADTNSASTGANSMTVTPTGALTGSTVTISGTYPNKKLTITPPTDKNGGPAIINWDIQATGGGSPTSTSFQVTVNAVNDAPQLTTGSAPAVNEDAGPQSVAGVARTGPATAVAFDEGSQTITSATFTPTGTTGNLAFSSGPTINGVGTLTYQAAPNTNGTATFNVTLQDSGGTANGGVNTTTSLPLTITVNAINDPPELTLPATQSSDEDAGLVSVTGFVTGIRPGPAAATDEAGQTLTITLTVTGTTGSLSFTTPPAIDVTTGTLTYQAAPGTNGTATVQVSLSDNGSNIPPNSNTSAPQTFTITVQSVNDPPVNTVPGTQTTQANTPKVFSTANGNAISVADVDAGSGSLQINLAVTSGTLTLGSTSGLTVSGNGTGSVTVTGTLANLNNGLQGLTFTPATNVTGIVTLTVTTNDQGNTGGPAQTDTDHVTIGVGSLPLLSVADVSAQEGNSGTSTMTFTVTLAPSSNLVVSVQAATTDGTAIAGSDYISTTQMLTFQPGETSKTVSVPILGDTLVEPDETFTLNLTSLHNALASRAQATGTIQNDDLGGTIQLSAPTYSAGETDGAVTITVQRVGGIASSVGVHYATSDGTAKAGSDYTAAAGTLTFAAGESVKTVNVPILSDRVDEPDETFTVTLSNVSGGATLGTPATATVTIREVDQTACQTTLTSSVPAGSTTLPVQSSAGCNVGDHIAINPGTSTEERTIITGFGSILIDQATTYAHTAGELVIRISIDADLGRATVPPAEHEDKPRKETAEERQQRQRTNRSNHDDEHTEGNVTAIACDTSPPTITIANRDGLVEIQLLHEAVQSCSSAQIGDYLEADGVKQTEQRFEGDTITLRRGGQRVK